MRKSLVVICSLLSLALQAQKASNPQPYAATITAEDLKKHLYIVASKEMEGRETATEGERKAAAYIENYFRSLGLLPGNNGSYRQPFPLYQDSMTNAVLTINGQSWQIDKDFAANVNNNHPFSLMARDVLYVGNGVVDSARDAYKDVTPLGRIVLVNPGRASANQYMTAAQRNGAALLLVVQPNFPRNPSPKGNLSSSEFRLANFINTFFISEKMAEAIMGADWAAAKAGNAPSKHYATELSVAYNETVNKLESSNVIGYIEGSDKKDEYVFLTAHYDHNGKRGDSIIFYGADDDGSGTVSLLEMAEAFTKAKAQKKGPRRSIVFMAVSGEEKGLLGSAYYSEHPTFPLEKTTVDLNIDMIGRIDPTRKNGDSMNYVYVVGDDKLSSDLRPISEGVNSKYTKLELDYKFNDPNDRQRIYFRSDHYNFARKGVPIIFYFNGTHADYHRPTDTPDKINYDLFAKRAQFVFYTAWEMANRQDMLKRDLSLQVPPRGF
ncbi:MAG TPA: M28 family peptidase [Chitinophagaceae bacterium]|nr:M28 family peptidase [Chitinophagaceae bacterium]